MPRKKAPQSENKMSPSRVYLEIKFEKGKICPDGARIGYINVNKFKGLKIPDPLPGGIKMITAPPKKIPIILHNAIVIVDDNNKRMGTGKNGATSKEDIESILSGNFNGLVETSNNQHQQFSKEIELIKISFTKDGRISSKGRRIAYIDVNKFKGLIIPDPLPDGIKKTTATLNKNQIKHKAIVIVNGNNKLMGRGIEGATSKEDIESILSGNFNGLVATYLNQHQKSYKKKRPIENDNQNQDDDNKNNKRQKKTAINGVEKRTKANDNQGDKKKKNNKRQKNIAINDVKKPTAINNVKERTMANDNQPVEGLYNLRFFNNNPDNKSNNSRKQGSLQNDDLINNTNQTTSLTQWDNRAVVNQNPSNNNQNHGDGDFIINVFNINNW